jgi:hypothetical protein
VLPIGGDHGVGWEQWRHAAKAYPAPELLSRIIHGVSAIRVRTLAPRGPRMWAPLLRRPSFAPP